MIAALLAAAALVQAPAPPAAASAEAERRALAVIERTKTTRATYALYSWNWIRDPDGTLRDEWSAEFNSGSRHRVETPGARVVADCAAQTGTALDLTSGKRFTGRHIAQFACGISTARTILEVSWQGGRGGRFGDVDWLRVRDAEAERFYAVDDEGILVGAEIHALAGANCLQSEAVAVQRRLPAGDLFSVTSLGRSVVPERYKRAPARPVGDLWNSGRACPSAPSARTN